MANINKTGCLKSYNSLSQFKHKEKHWKGKNPTNKQFTNKILEALHSAGL
jgi:hypothetical protein